MTCNIAITGHTNGLGKDIYKHFDCQLGFSRSTGYNISKEKDRKRIVAEADKCDVFINNAYSFEDGFAQTQLLWELKEFPGLIINIASSIETVIRDDVRKYDIHKRSLIDASKQLYYAGVKSCVLCPGAIDTGLGNFVKIKKISVTDILKTIEYMINMDGTVQQIIMTARHQ